MAKLNAGNPCPPDTLDDEVGMGTNVIIKNGRNEPLAIALLTNSNSPLGRMEIRVNAKVEDEDFYQFSIEKRVERKTMSRAELAGKDWTSR
jgi:hypothetical protein